jgi:hypothetical protein
MWDNGPQAHSRVSNINFYICKKIVEGALIYFSWDIYRDPLHNLFSNIKVDI